MSLVAGAQLLDLSGRQAKRVWQRYQDQGDAGLVHRGRGRATNPRMGADLRKRVMDCETIPRSQRNRRLHGVEQAFDYVRDGDAFGFRPIIEQNAVAQGGIGEGLDVLQGDVGTPA